MVYDQIMAPIDPSTSAGPTTIASESPEVGRSTLITTLKVFVLGFALGSGWIVYHSRELRGQLEERVHTLSALGGLSRTVEMAFAAPAADGAAQDRLRQAVEDVEQLRPGLIAALPEVPVARSLDELHAGLIGLQATPPSADAALRANEAIGTLSQALRLETAAISTSLGSLWSGLNVLVLVALAFAWATLSYATHSRGLEAALGRLREALALSNATAERASEAEAEAQRQIELFVALGGGGGWTWSAGGAMRYSRAWRGMLGLPADAPLEALSDWFDRLHPDDRAPVEEAFERHLFGGDSTLDLRYRIRHEDGRWRRMRTQATSERGATGEVERMAGLQLEGAEPRVTAPLPDRSALLRQVSDGLGLGLLTLHADGSISSLGPTLERLTAPWGDISGWWRAVQRNLSWPRQVTCPTCRQTVPTGPSVAEVYTAEGARRTFRIHWTGHGHSLSADDPPLVLTVEDITDDTTQREDVQDVRHDLARTREEMNTIIERSHDAIALVADGRVLYGNLALRQLVGVSEPEGLAGRRFEDLVRVPAGSRPGTLPELRRPDGRSLPVVVAAPLPIEFQEQQVELISITPGWFARLDDLDPDSSLDGVASLVPGTPPPPGELRMAVQPRSR